MISNSEENNLEENKNVSYKQLLETIRDKAKIVASKAIPALYKKLLEEGKKPTEARIILEHDLSDIWSKVTINTYLPDETKDEQKVKARKVGIEKQKEKEIMLSTQGQILNNSVKESTTEQSSVSQNKPNSAFSEVFEDIVKKNDRIAELEQKQNVVVVEPFWVKFFIEIGTTGRGINYNLLIDPIEKKVIKFNRD